MAGTKRRGGGGTRRGPSAPPTKRGRPSKSEASDVAIAIAERGTALSVNNIATATSDTNTTYANLPPSSLSHANATTTTTMMDPQEEYLATSSSLFEYLERLPVQTLRSMYGLPSPRGPIVSASVLRSSCLTELARQFVLRLVACGGSFAVSSILEGWVNRSASSQGDALLALKRLETMGIVEPNLGLAIRHSRNMETSDDENDFETDASDREDNGLAKLMGKDAKLTPEFRESMKLHLSTLSSSPWAIITQEQILASKVGSSMGHRVVGRNDEDEKPSRDPPTLWELDAYTQSSWDSVLHFLVGSDDDDSGRIPSAGAAKDGRASACISDVGESNSISEPSEAMVQFLKRIGLMQEDPDYAGRDRSRAPLVITSKGYEFMLRDTNAQVWQFVLQYLNSLAHHYHHENMDSIRIDALSYLICLGSTRVGDGYHISTVVKNKAARQIMKDFGRFGLVFFCRVAGKTAFYPTSLVVNLIASNEKTGRHDVVNGTTSLLGPSSVATARSLEQSLSASIPSRSHLAVIVQTNFQVVAYTRSKLHISTLGLFCDVSSYRRLPNMIIFFITRDSIKSAFRLGVTAAQILRFLHVHAHPMLQNNTHIVPTNVSDQILLWDRERKRVTMDEVWVHQCRDASEFSAIGQYASDIEALAWGAAYANKLYIHFRKHEQVETFIRKWKTRQLIK